LLAFSFFPNLLFRFVEEQGALLERGNFNGQCSLREIEDYCLFASRNNHAVLINAVHCAIIIEELFLSPQFQHFLQLFPQCADRSTCEDTPS
jgi:hypothetical protein